MHNIVFNKPFISDNAEIYLKRCLHNNAFEDGIYSQSCEEILKKITTSSHVLLTSSCTSGLDIIALALGLEAGDEVILPSYTFVSTANAFSLRGAIPVFVDIRSDTLNINENLIEQAITKKTKAIVAVHYAGISCEMDSMRALAAHHNLYLIEDAAQGLGAYYDNKPLGCLGDVSALSFHYTKNITAGLGGALLINNDEFLNHARVAWQKGTNRHDFINGVVDKYTWVGLGSSFMMSELNAALLLSQLEIVEEITQKRLRIWQRYHDCFKTSNRFRSPIIPDNTQHNAHMYYLIMDDSCSRQKFMKYMKEHNISAHTHFVPLHNSPAGKAFGRTSGALIYTEDLAERLIRLPLYAGMTDEEVDYVIRVVEKF